MKRHAIFMLGLLSTAGCGTMDPTDLASETAAPAAAQSFLHGPVTATVQNSWHGGHPVLYFENRRSLYHPFTSSELRINGAGRFTSEVRLGKDGGLYVSQKHGSHTEHYRIGSFQAPSPLRWRDKIDFRFDGGQSPKVTDIPYVRWYFSLTVNDLTPAGDMKGHLIEEWEIEGSAPYEPPHRP